MYKTKIDLSEKVRRNVIVILNDRLADAIDLQSQVKQAHWNVKGPHFIALHELFDKISDLVLEQIDEIAERVTSLGGTAEGTVAVAAKRSKLKNYPLSITAGKDHLFYLSTQLSVYRQGRQSGHRGHGQAGRCRHRGSVHGNLPRYRQVSLVPRSAPAREGLMTDPAMSVPATRGSSRPSRLCADCSPRRDPGSLGCSIACSR
jgi:starvation-inducible DNA-binding protein